MSLKEILAQEMENSFAVTRRLFQMVAPGQLGWKPETGTNWLTVAQLMMHCSSSCGAAMRAFVTGDWGLPEGVDFKDLTPEEMLPPAEKFPAVESVEQALQLLEEDHRIAVETLAGLEEEKLLAVRIKAPWGGLEFTLFQQLLHMVGHLDQHKGQLFYYLKLLGKKVSTPDLWGDV